MQLTLYKRWLPMNVIMNVIAKRRRFSFQSTGH
jgi:hypothetical protein